MPLFTKHQLEVIKISCNLLELKDKATTCVLIKLFASFLRTFQDLETDFFS